MKSKILFSLAILSFLFVQQLAAQDVVKLLQDKEDRQMLYYSIVNDDERFGEFMEAVKLSGRSQEGLETLEENRKGNAENTGLSMEKQKERDEVVMDQMISLMEIWITRDPDFQKVIEEKFPEVNEFMKSEKLKL